MSKRTRIFSTVYGLALATAIVYNPFHSVQAKAAPSTWVEGKAECVMEVNSRRILYASNADQRLPMASTTKILTAATVLEETEDLEEVFPIPQEAVGVEGSSVYLQTGDEYSIKELLYGLMLRSGNDCAVALATHTSGSVERFSAKMNETAMKAGALESCFLNPHGLPEKGHYTTAKDLSLITCYAMQNPVFAEIVSTRYYEPRNWLNKNKTLTRYEGGIGVKTGYTKEAGRCLVSAANRNGMTLVCSVLHCPTTYERSFQLLDDAFASYEYVPIVKQGETLTLLANDKKISVYVDKTYSYPLLQEEKALIEIKTSSHIESPERKKKGEIVGQFEIYLLKRLLFLGNLYKL